MRHLLLSFVLLSASSAHADPTHGKKHATSKKKRRAARQVDVLEPAEPGKVPPGAQLGPDRVIEAPQAPGPDTSPGRVEAPASEIEKPKRDDRDRTQPPWPTGPDSGRNTQPATGFSPSSKPIVP